MLLRCEKCENFIANSEEQPEEEKEQHGANRNKCLKVICQSCDRLMDTCGALATLQEAVEDIRSKIHDANHQGWRSIDTVNRIIEEIELRKYKAKNVIVYDVPENDSRNLQDRIAADVETVKRILRPVDELNVDKVLVTRIDRSNRSKLLATADGRCFGARPLKIIFATEAEALKVLRSKDKIVHYNVVADLTVMQRNYLRKVHEEFNRRIGNGEINIIIKYVNRTPTIIRKKWV